MTEHHGLDLAEMERQANGHSIFAPSASYGWLVCADYFKANFGKPDNAGYDAAEGTVGHEIGEIWLTDISGALQSMDWRPSEMDEEEIRELIDDYAPTAFVGTTRHVVERVDEDGKELVAFDVPITEEMLAYVRQYVLWCLVLPGDHFIETRVDFSQITPIPNQGGTADHAACEPGVLTITDLKYGKGIPVSAAEDLDSPLAIVNGVFNGNPQAMLYALGFFYKYDHIYHFERIIIRIAQPRLEIWQTWETTREQLLAFARYAKIKAHDTWVKDTPRTPSVKGCRFCKAKGDCAALAAFDADLVEGVFDDVSDIIDGQYRVVDDGRALAVKAQLDAEVPFVEQRDAKSLTTAQMAKLLLMRKTIESKFEAMYEELTFRVMNGEKAPGWKLVEGREGDRKWILEDDAAEHLRFFGLTDKQIYVKKLATPAQIVEKIRAAFKFKKKEADELIKHLVSRTPGKDTLVPLSDKREAIDDVGLLFDKVEDEEL